jgi:hypothetical protein
VNLTSLMTSVAQATAADGKLRQCQGGSPRTVGRFGRPTCAKIIEMGAPAGAVPLNTPAPVLLASVFCIAATPNGLVNFAADLRGPASASPPPRLVTNACFRSVIRVGFD